MRILVSIAFAFLIAGCTTRRESILGSSEKPFATSSGTVSISGQVLRPGTYPHRLGMNVKDLIADAGGALTYAQGITVIRRGTNVVDGSWFISPRATIRSNAILTILESDDVVKIHATEM
jgi:hypothetical protein